MDKDRELRECIELCVEEFGEIMREECEKDCKEFLRGDNNG